MRPTPQSGQRSGVVAVSAASAPGGFAAFFAATGVGDASFPVFFRVQGSGFRVQGSGFRVQGSGFRVQGSGFRV